MYVSMILMACLFTDIDDVEFAEECHKAFLRGQNALDRLLWNETARYYNAYTYEEKQDLHNPSSAWQHTHVHGEPNDTLKQYGKAKSPLGAIMTDTFYSQVNYICVFVCVCASVQ